jgi:hypothetical protein
MTKAEQKRQSDIKEFLAQPTRRAGDHPMTGGFNTTCSRCDRSFSSASDFHTHVAQGCK